MGNRHTCFVFLSDKLAEEITLTIGQAFELAYKKFLESKGKDLEKEKQSMVMHKRIELLENENKELKKRLTDIANIKGDNDVKQYMRENNISEICTVAPVLSSSESSNNPSSGEDPTSAGDNTSNKNSDSNSNNGDLNLKDLNSVTIQSSQSVNELICLDESTSSISQTDFGGTTLDNFTLDDLNDDEFNPRAVDSQLKQQQQQQLPSTLVQVLTANEPTTTPTGLLVPPPALPA